MDTVDNAITKPARRLEVFTGAGRRRTWSDEDKARVVAEIESSGDSVSGVARRHGLSPQQLFGWRRQVREAQAVISKDNEVRFVPAVVDAARPVARNVCSARRGDSIGTNHSSERSKLRSTVRRCASALGPRLTQLRRYCGR